MPRPLRAHDSYEHAQQSNAKSCIRNVESTRSTHMRDAVYPIRMAHQSFSNAQNTPAPHWAQSLDDQGHCAADPSTRDRHHAAKFRNKQKSKSMSSDTKSVGYVRSLSAPWQSRFSFSEPRPQGSATTSSQPL